MLKPQRIDHDPRFVDKNGYWDLQKVAEFENQRLFADCILLDEIKWVRDLEAEIYFCGGYYIGDRYGGKVHVVYYPKMEPCCQIPIRTIVCHEMLHQLIPDHNPDFKAIEVIYRPRHWGDTAPQSTYRLLAKYLLNNIVAKIDKGLLPPEHLEKFKQSQILKRSLQ